MFVGAWVYDGDMKAAERRKTTQVVYTILCSTPQYVMKTLVPTGLVFSFTSQL